MANTQATFGFKHVGYLSGYAPDYQQSTRGILKTYSTVIGFGDPVQKTNATSAYIVQGNAATTGPIEGIFVGCTFQIAGQAPTWSPFWPGSTAAADATAYVIDAPGALFLAATLLTAVVSSNLGAAINYTFGGLTATTVGQGFSVATLDQASIGTTSGTTITNLPFKIVSLYGGGTGGSGNGSDSTTNYNWVVVTFNAQTWKTMQAWG
jgi:hypothetical protein